MRFINDSTNKYYDLEKYNKTLEQLVTAKKEITLLKSQIQKMENDKKKVKESLFRCKTDENDDNDEEEFDMVQLEEGMKKKNRSEDLNIDFPNETRQKYQELEERFNNLKEQVVPILKSNANKNITKNNVTKICNLLGTSVNTTNNILEKYNK